MKILKIVLIALLSICNYINCFGQDYPTNDSVINKTIAQFQKKGIDTICTYQYYFPGAIRFIKSDVDTTCFNSNYSNVYFLWKYKGATYITLKNACSNYDTIRIDGDKLWKFYNENGVRIRAEKIMPFQIVAVNHGKKEIETIYIDHSPRQEIGLNIGKKSIKLYFDAFALQKATGDRDDNRININYSFNNNAKSNKFKIMLEDIIKGVLSEKILKKINK